MNDDKPAIRLGSTWVDADLRPWLPAAIFIMSTMVLENLIVLPTEADNEFGGTFFTGAEIVARALKLTGVLPEDIDDKLIAGKLQM